MSVYFGSINPENWRIFKALKVKDEQKDFVAPNVTMLARAFAYRDYNSKVHAIYNDDEPVGMIMQNDYNENGKKSCVLTELMIAEQYQGKGYGKEALQLWISMIKNENKYDSIILCYIEGDKIAENLYLNMGFYHTGDVDEDEILMEYNL